MQSPHDPGRGVALAHDDYCRAIGQVVLDAQARIRSLEAQLAQVAAALRAEAERRSVPPPAPIPPHEARVSGA